MFFNVPCLHGVERCVPVYVGCDSDEVFAIPLLDSFSQCAEEVPGKHFFKGSLENRVCPMREVDWFWPRVGMYSNLVVGGNNVPRMCAAFQLGRGQVQRCCPCSFSQHCPGCNGNCRS